MKNTIFWDVVPCRSCVNRRFGGMFRLCLQGIRNLQARNQCEQVAADTSPTHAGSSLADFLYPEDGGDTFLRNVG
jgi:hypothetical protein